MRIVVNEKQLHRVLKANLELSEVEGEGGKPESGASSDGEKKTGASKWESGVTRGPANQIGNTKWSDVVGSQLKRGKANPLSEQVTNINPKNLKFGDGGSQHPEQIADVKALQQKLMDMKLLKTDTMKPTGYFGSLTKAAFDAHNSSQKSKLTDLVKSGAPKAGSDIKSYPACVASETSNSNRAELKKTKSNQYYIEVYVKHMSGYQFYNNGRVMKPNGQMGNYSCNGSSILIDGVDISSQEWNKVKDKYVTNYEKSQVDKATEMAGKMGKWDVHDVLTVLEMGALFIPVAGPFISAGIGLGNAALYYKEGDTKTAGLFALFSLLPFVGEIPGVKQLGKAGMEALAKKISLEGEKAVLTTLEKETLQAIKADEKAIVAKANSKVKQMALDAAAKVKNPKVVKSLKKVGNVGLQMGMYYGVAKGYDKTYDKYFNKSENPIDILSDTKKPAPPNNYKEEDLVLVDGEYEPRN